MATSKQDISEWYDRGKKGGATHLIVVTDTFDYTDYPVYATGDADCLEKFHQFNDRNMQRIMEVYDLRLDKDTQMTEHRAWHMPS